MAYSKEEKDFDLTNTSSPVVQDGDIFTAPSDDPLGSERPPLMTRLGLTVDSFRQRTLADKHNQLNKTLKPRHLNMIAIGGSIGAGFFVGSGGALSTGGPAALLIGFGIIGIMIFNVVYALGELAIMFPISGGFYTYSNRFIDPSWGFAMGWNYVLQWAVVLPLELVVAGLTVNYWDTGVNVAVWITIFYVAIIVICVFGVLGYAEEEFWVALLKLSTIIIFMIMGVIFACGGGPKSGMYGEYWGARTWYNPGAFAQGFYGVCAVFVTAAFSFSGTELVGLAAAESENPQRALPSAIKQVFWRITLFYIVGLFFVGLLVPHDDGRLLGSGLIDVSASPFVIVAVNAGIPAFGDFVNVVILFSVVSIGLSGVYGGSRTLTALAEQGYAPKIFAYVDRAGRPLFSTIAILAFGPIAYVTLASSGETVFAWLLALSGLAALFTWGSICLAHIRFRAAWKMQGHSLKELTFASAFGVYGSWVGLILIAIVLIAQFYTAVKPMSAYAFFQSYLAAPVVIFFYIVGYIWKRKAWIKTSQIDVDSGRREVDFEHAEELRVKMEHWPAWRRVLDRVF
ncbi:Amino-acid permease inda1 [Elasticomyces elasticus]|nr:Amino-acid permease inda1 [Elasticomyces elasticus]KAK3627388.1 Amino-acid permease inda1 [Elasticomyces elasticus]KAK4904424.1 Amino-acid permease inda1 [Elasticomyces elasticus]KAK5739721.1 Amino-acid permease inda1 [Elasticomyces elasticus]